MRGILVRGLSILLVVSLLVPGSAFAEESLTTPALIITEVKIRNDTAGLDEFIEIYNPGIEPVNLNDYTISYVNTSTPLVDARFDEAIVGTGLLEPGKGLVLAKVETVLNLPFSKKSPFSSLSDSGGTLRITDAADNIIDEFAWTSTLGVAISPIQYLCTSSTTSCNLNRAQSFTRQKDENNNYLLAAAWTLTVPSPESSVLLPAPEPEPEPDTEPLPDQTTNTQDLEPEEPAVEEPEPVAETLNITLSPVQITELLPNPAPPLTDTLDEFVEIYNPNETSIDVSGYKVQTGNTYSYSYELDNVTIPAHGYITLTSGNSNLALANTGGKARLLDPNGVVIYETSAYSDAPEGQAWANIGGKWQWTTTPSPLAENSLTLPTVASKVSTKKTAATKKKAATKPKTTAKKASAKGASTKKAPTNKTEDAFEEVEEPEIVPVHTGTLAIIGGLTLVYAGYEYRNDVLNRLYQFRRYREARRAARG